MAAPVEAFAAVRFAAGLRAGDLRVAPAVAFFARVEVVFLAVDRLAVDLRAPPVEAARCGAAPSSAVHLPDITRCAASATASAINEPSLVALAIILVAACDAVSAASRPASRIARRALGLALIAAAAAANPAASISLLIAALASLSTVSLPEVFFEVVFVEDFATLHLPPFGQKDTLAP
ncbi:MAG TPA: hypothetical protein VGE68_05945 [Sphingomicrobium sp.]